MIFELPVLVFFLSVAGIVDPRTLLRTWRYALVIIVTAAATHVPPPLIEQLRPGGRMVIPVGSRFLTRWKTCSASG